MTNLEIIAIKSVASRINSLAHLENTCFDPFNKEHDEQIKKDIRVLMLLIFTLNYREISLIEKFEILKSVV